MKKLTLIFVLGMCNLTYASNGVLDINETCATVGCFPDDSASFPITITEAGSYQLTSDLESSLTGTNVIDISASNVTIDLNGFAIIGPRTCTGFAGGLTCTDSGMTSDGIAVTASTFSNIVVKNGSVKGFDTGIALLTGGQNSNFVYNIQASENQEGIIVSNGLIRDSQANRNLRFGFSGTHVGTNNGTLKVMDSSAYGNREHSVHAEVCSNVLFQDNGTNSSADSDCTYTNESTCKIVAQCL